MKQLLVFAFIAALNVLPSLSLAQSGDGKAQRYIVDKLWVPLRAGKGNQYRIVNRGLISGTKLNLVEEDPEGEWALVSTQNGQEGWIRTQFLQDTPIAKEQLILAQQQLSGTQQQLANLKNNLDENKQGLSDIQQQLADKTVEANQLAKELAEIQQISANAIQLHKNHQELMKNYQVQQAEIDIIKAKNEQLADRTLQTWFLYGALAVLLGVVITLVVPRLKPKKSYAEWA